MNSQSIPDFLTRRHFLGRSVRGLGTMALASLLNPTLFAQADKPPIGSKGLVQPLHHPAKVRRVIYLYMAGGPSHLETFDPKPKLGELHGKPMPESFTRGQQLAQLQGQELKCFGPQWGFRRYGKSGLEFSENLPLLGGHADEMCLIRSMYTDQINHDPAHMLMNTGSIIAGRPSFGSWLLYGLGSETEDLPGFVVMVSSGRGGQMQPIAARQWSSGMLPSRFQGVKFSGQGDPVLYLQPPRGVERGDQRQVIDAVNRLNRLELEQVADPEILTRIAQYEMAFRMQASVPDLMDTSREPAKVFELYGCRPGDGSFASNCLLARRLAERGTRFIQLYHRDWDHHGNLKNDIRLKHDEIDRACHALLTDLKERGMWDDTLVLWGGEFGRTPMSQSGNGRDHHIKGFTTWMAGGGVRGGFAHGATDELGYAAVDSPVHVNDLHATILHLFGIDHRRMTVRHQGLDVRLTGIAGEVVKDVLA